MEVILVVAREGSTCDFKINAGETDEIRIRLTVESMPCSSYDTALQLA